MQWLLRQPPAREGRKSEAQFPLCVCVHAVPMEALVVITVLLALLEVSPACVVTLVHVRRVWSSTWSSCGGGGGAQPRRPRAPGHRPFETVRPSRRLAAPSPAVRVARSARARSARVTAPTWPPPLRQEGVPGARRRRARGEATRVRQRSEIAAAS